MKIAFLVEHLDPRRGGLERSATEFLTEAAKLGLDIQAVTQTVSPDFNVVPVQALGVARGGRARRYREFMRRAEAFLGARHWDVIHSVSPCRCCDLYQPRAGTVKEALARTVAVRRTWMGGALRQLGAWLDAKHRLIAALEQDLFSRQPGPVVAALSSHMQRQIVENYRLPEKQVRVVFNGVSIRVPDPVERAATRARVRHELSLAPDALVAVFAGHNFRRKGLMRLLEALARPEASGWQLLVLGKDAPSAYAAAARRLGIAARVRFLGARSDVHAFYVAADAGVLPTYFDACARTVLEGVSLGLPCITTAFDGASDCIREGQCGAVIDSPDDVVALARALGNLAVPEVRRELSERASQMHARLSMRRHVQEIAALYEEIGGRANDKM